MRAKLMVRAASLLSCCTFLLPAPMAQMPAPLGRLHLTAGKDQKAREAITINNTPRNDQTPVTLAVVPGSYAVVIGSCPAQQVSVASGQTQEVTCAQ